MKVVYVSRRMFIMLAILLVSIAFISLAANVLPKQDTQVIADADKLIYQGNTGKKMVSITVNVDWGEEFIPAMLAEFKKNNAQVTFFVTGIWAEKNPDLLKQMKADGHSIQNHGYKHLHFNNLTAEQIQEQIKKAEKIIFETTGKPSTYFASPYGEHNDKLVNTVSGMDYRFIMWSVDTIDWQRPSPDIIVNRVMKRVHNDAIILMHPTDPTVKALPEMLKQLRAENYQLVSIDKIVMDQGKKDSDGK